tara:strand:+ start:4959 stop:14645 length:9687 start_codon:yes stop_codon:yes gene_type:complete
MSLKKLFQKNKQAVTVGKYLKASSPDDLGNGIESQAHLSASLERQKYFLPAINYGDPKNFVKFGSAEQYYKNAFEYIANYFPYDGSVLERTSFYNDINPLEKYVLEDIYPRSTGYVTIGADYGTLGPSASGYYSSSAEYIQIKGGPHSGSIYNESKNRTSNLEFGGVSGSTVEFFLKKEELTAVSSLSSDRQVIFDLWNGAATTDATYGRMRIELRQGSEDRFYVTMLSGTTGFDAIPVPTTGSISISDGTFRNFSFVFNTSGSSPTLDFFVNGTCIQTAIPPAASATIGLVTGSMIGNLGALRTDVVGLPGAAQGYGKLSGSIDEFRFWKTSRNDEQIGRYWLSSVGGGSNKYDANVGLGVYLKFNEGITGTSSIDDAFLDYSGRLSNGAYTGYNALYSRNTGSAVNSLNLTSVSEVASPIVRSQNPLYTTKKAQYISSGSNYDYQNNSRLMNNLPNWIIETEENGANEIVDLTQIISSYFDTLYNQLTVMKALKYTDYISGSVSSSINQFPYNDRLVESFGIEVPEIFENIGTLSQFLQRDEQINFEQTLSDVKNSIYKNIYNNLSYILKSKGNEKAIRNFIRCLGVGEDVIALNTYPSNSDFQLKSNYFSTSSPKKFADFTGLLNQSDDGATVYQYYDSLNTNSIGFITGSSVIEEFAFALQTEFVFPNKENFRQLEYEIPRVIVSSLAGFHTPFDSSQTSTDLTWQTPSNDYGIQIYAIRSPGEYAKVYSPLDQVRDAYFVVKDRAGETLLTSPIFNEVYDNQKWNLTLSLRPKKYPFSDGINGASIAGDGYYLELYGVNYDTGMKRNSFLVSASMTPQDGANILESNKRIYVGAHRTNYTGTVLVPTDVRASSVRYWTDYFPTGTLDLQAKEADTHGRVRPYRNAYSFQTQNPGVYIPRIQTLAMNWEFTDITGSNASGRFGVSDLSSGSVANDYVSQYQNPVFSKINLRQHTGRGDFFVANTTPVRKEYVYSDKLQVPEYIGTDSMVQVLSSDDQTFGVYARPVDFFFAVEKSMYRSISNQMLKLFASIEDFNNLIGEPVNKYRLNYKRMEKIREIFFRKVRNDIPDLEKYINYYKWLDTSMSEMIEQLFPESARFAESVRKVVENHVLERPKIQHRAAILRDRRPWGPPGITGGPSTFVCYDAPGWKFNHAPLSNAQNENCFWWNTRALRSNPLFETPVGLLPTRNAILNAVQRDQSKGAVVCLSAEPNFPYYGGVNQTWNKKRNMRDLTFSRFEPLEDCVDATEPNQKKKISFRVELGSDLYKGDNLAPFTAISSSVTSGYNAGLIASGLAGISITNLHEDSILPFRHSVPLQGPFTKRHVGGIQARHNAPFRTTDRAEEYTLEIASGTGSITSLTDEIAPKGKYLRGAASKSPVNIENIKTVIVGHTVGDGVRLIGNYSKYYEVVQGNDRSETNMDFVFNTSFYAYSEPSAFITPPDRRTLGLTGSADYPAPRQRTGVRTNETIFADRFSAPGSKQDSKQLFRDVNSNTMSPNNALPFRNEAVRRPGNLAFRTRGTPLGAGAGLAGYLRLHTGWGGFQGSIEPELADAAASPSIGVNALQHFNDGGPPAIATAPLPGFPNINNIMLDGTAGADVRLAALHKTQRNTTKRIEISGSLGIADVMKTGSVYDNAYVTRPIPSADRAEWTSYISGTATIATYNEYIAKGERYPDNITFATEFLNAPSTWWPALFYDTSLSKQFIWGKNYDFAIWKQIRNSDNPAAKYYWQNNTYELLPEVVESNVPGTNIVQRGFAPGTLVREMKDITFAENVSKYYSSVSLREAPITSRYKPLVHQIRTPLGTPSKTSNEKITVSLNYSYGTELMGFANRRLNVEFKGKPKWSYGLVKRPYEILREQRVPGTERSVAGLDLIKVFSYPETIYPKEVYTYLSGSRSRFSYICDFWREDIDVTSYDVSAFTSYANILSEANQLAYVPQRARLKSPFVTSQGSVLLNSVQTPYNSLDASYQLGEGFGSGSIWPMDSYLYADSTGSLVTILTQNVPVLFADAATMASGELMTTHYGTINDQITNPVYSANTASYATSSINSAQYVYNIPVMGASIITTPAVAAEAEITAVETVPSILNGLTFQIDTTTVIVVFTFDETSATPGGGGAAYTVGVLGTATANDVINRIYDAITAAVIGGDIDVTPIAPGAVSSAMDITADVAGVAMNVKTITGTAEAGGQITVINWAGGVDASATAGNVLPEVRSPGSAYTRPAWTAGRERRYVDGPSKGQLASTSYPFYDNYEQFHKDTRLAGQESTIIPEFRISEHVSEYEANGSLYSIISSSLEITGANANNYDGSNPLFYERFAQTDNIEFLSNFMPTDKGDRNYIFNKYPRHFEIESEAKIKLLPYSGFYPVDRTLDLASLFHTTYISQSLLSSPSAVPAQGWRAILRPFYAPGIMYNSLKSGIAVNYPIRRAERNGDQYFEIPASSDPLAGCLSGSLVTNPAGTIPGNTRRNNENFDWTNEDVNRFFWADKLPFETILSPVDALEAGFTDPTVLSDIREFMTVNVSGSIIKKGLDDSLYKKAVSNFLANVPKFFLSRKVDGFGGEGYLTKFVSQFGTPPSAKEGSVTTPVRTVDVDKNAAYMMEIGLMKTDQFNFYSNPYAYGIPTSTGSISWESLNADQIPKPNSWPNHRAEFAPFTPPHYYGPSVARITFMPLGDKTSYTLDEIVNNDRGEVYVQFINESGSHYDMASGSFVTRAGAAIASTATPTYGWNRAWQNRMDIDASISIGNEFVTDYGSSYISIDPNKWTIMPKWECPTLDFPDRSAASDEYAFSSSVDQGFYTSSAQGMWHQYGTMPNNNEGSYLYIKDIPTGAEEEYDLVAIPYAGATYTERSYTYVKKIPDFVIDSERTVRSMADLVGFSSDEIIRSGFDTTRAKRLGELAPDNEKSISEAILALPFYIDEKDQSRLITLQAPADKLGPKIKQFRKQFTKFSLPPSLAKNLLSMVPSDYPHIPDYINPFGGDEYDSIMSGEKMITTPVVYLMEHKVNLTRQDLADIWQGVMPELSTKFQKSVSAIDHYMPGDNVEEETTRFPEIIKAQLNLGAQMTGHPRYDLLDIAQHPEKLGLFPEIKWLVFKVKERGLLDYSQLITEEVDGEFVLDYDNARRRFSGTTLTPENIDAVLGDRDGWSKAVYKYHHSLEHSNYNWPYDYCSLIELGKINTKISFRPDLAKENEEDIADAELIARQLRESTQAAGLGANLGDLSNLARNLNG